MDDEDAPMIPTTSEYLQTVATQAMTAKEACVVNGPEDLIPMCVWFGEGRDKAAMFPLVPLYLGNNGPTDGPSQHPMEVFVAAAPIMRKEAGRPVLISFALDVYAAKGAAAIEKAETGVSLGELFARGDPNVTEAIFVMVGDREGFETLWVPYHYGDGGVVWDDNTVVQEYMTGDGADIGGRITEAMRDAFIDPEAN